MSCPNTDELQDQLKIQNDKLFHANNHISELQEELRLCKEFFGYNTDMNMKEMVEYKDECEEEEKTLKENDPDFADECNKSDHLVDLVVELGEYQYAVADVYSNLKRIAEDDVAPLRKKFSSSFLELKEVILEENIDEFFDIIHHWLSLQRKIHLTDQKIIDAQT